MISLKCNPCRECFGTMASHEAHFLEAHDPVPRIINGRLSFVPRIKPYANPADRRRFESEPASARRLACASTARIEPPSAPTASPAGTSTTREGERRDRDEYQTLM